MTHVTRACSMLIAAALGLVAAAAPALSENAPQCAVSGSPPAGWGSNSIGYIEIASGGSCLFSVNITGEALSSSISQNPARGTLQQLNVSSFVYTSQAGYSGSDIFSVQASGKSPTSSGTSVITINATLQQRYSNTPLANDPLRPATRSCADVDFQTHFGLNKRDFG
jgi:hypothetical protein